MMNSIESLYLHVPFCKHLCNYCDFYKVQYDKDKNQLKSYHEYLLKTVKTHQEFLDKNQFILSPLKTLYLGGGTPSLWGTKGSRFFKDEILGNYIILNQENEFTMEFDPGSWTTETYDAWKELGVNRISIGSQAFSNDLLKVLDRSHNLDETKRTLKFFQKQRENFSADFLLGVPNSKDLKRNIKNEIDQILEYDPSHLSLYILKTRANYPLKSSLPDDDYIRDEYLFICDYLEQNGLKQYEVANFAKPGFESKHNLSYWKQESVAALGPNATGFLKNDQFATRYQWAASSGKISTERLTENELQMEQVYLALRLCEPDNLLRFWDESKEKSVNLLINKWTHSGYFSRDKKRLTSQGLLMLDSLMDDLFSAGLA